MRKIIALCAGLVSFTASNGQAVRLSSKTLEPVNVTIKEVTYKGKDGVRVIGIDPQQDQLAVVKGIDFTDGIIEVELAGKPLPEADSTHRGFIGMAFRVSRNDTVAYESFYIRPTNGRSSDQARRNHATQYVSHPKYPWFKLRKENPSVYESYADLVTGEWTKIRIVVRGKNARLFVNDASQPCLIVNDLKRGISSGEVALWINPLTDAYFRNLKITRQ